MADPRDTFEIAPVTTAVDAAPAESGRKPYSAPTLTDLGSFAEVTRGTFAGVGADSGIYS